MLLFKCTTFPTSRCDGFAECDKLNLKMHCSMSFSTSHDLIYGF